MNKQELLDTQEKYYDSVNKWFVSELEKWSKKHNTYLEHYGILRMWKIGSEDVYEPYSNWVDEELVPLFEEALKDYHELIDDLGELGVTSWQGLEYSEDKKFLH